MELKEYVDSASFYSCYCGHRLRDLQVILNEARRQKKRVIFLVGDSSLDNKFWLYSDGNQHRFVHPVYASVMSPPWGVRDVAYWMNEANTDYCTINCAVEESTLVGRDVKQDDFVRDNLQPGDAICISVGGNDLALKPSGWTLAAMGTLNYLTPSFLLSTSVPYSGLGSIFKTGMEAYVNRLTEHCRAVRVVICSIYYPCDTGSGWADRVLSLLNPDKVKRVLDLMHQEFTSRVEVHDVDIRPLALSQVLDCANPDDYVKRVEPSVQGGKKIAQALLEKVIE